MGQRLTLTAGDGHSLGAYRADASGATHRGMLEALHGPSRQR